MLSSMFGKSVTANFFYPNKNLLDNFYLIVIERSVRGMISKIIELS